MKLSKTRPVVLQRITYYPALDPEVIRQFLGQSPQERAPTSVWVAVGVNTQEVVAQAPTQDSLRAALAIKGDFKVQKVCNDWN